MSSYLDTAPRLSAHLLTCKHARSKPYIYICKANLTARASTQGQTKQNMTQINTRDTRLKKLATPTCQSSMSHEPEFVNFLRNWSRGPPQANDEINAGFRNIINSIYSYIRHLKCPCSDRKDIKESITCHNGGLFMVII